ncbi:MAG: translesion error-prone DNA polymerase V autoproteolytic subunit [Pseudodesulfovibrio sp.]
MEPLGKAVPESASRLAIPLYLDAVPAGFPSPADDYVETALDLNRYLVANPAATFMVRVCGDSMTGAGIRDGDVLVVDRSRDPVPGRIVVAVLDGELTVKRLCRRRGRIVLMPENDVYEPIEVREGQELTVWGVVTGVVRKL